MKFSELNLKPELMAGLKEIGYTELTPIQEQTFSHVLSGRDMIATAETGSGKTAACAVPLVQEIDTSLNAIQVLVLVPTRELALQYVREISEIAKKTPVIPFAVYGGFSMPIQVSKLAHGVHILVATPGRLIDLLYNSPLRLSEVKTFILDEADEMLNMGFIGDVEFVISCLIHEHQTLLFSATMPSEIKRLAARYLKDPVTIELNIRQRAPENLEHHFQMVKGHERFEILVEYFRHEKPKQAIIFCNSRRNVEKLYDHLKKKFDSVDMIHGGLEQSRRTSLFNRFKRMNIRFMVATDVASRGLDFSHASHVVNYDFPMNPEAYTHRTGRTARMGRKGIALTPLTRGNLRELKTAIKVNQLKPIWHGREPDLERAPQKRAGGGYSGGRSRRGGSGGGRGRGRRNNRASGRG
ncbi:MAG: DEAD/DEAH box helicase [Planctomycetes bacterium]|nr:DEAD/DEAH box helicase [Planctomycetota bacterium]